MTTGSCNEGPEEAADEEDEDTEVPDATGVYCKREIGQTCQNEECHGILHRQRPSSILKLEA